jgi:hypothetical protein
MKNTVLVFYRIFKAVSLGAALSLVALAPLVLDSCEQSAEEKCDCTDKIHGDGPCDCGAGGCDCKQKNYQLRYNMILEDQTGGLVGTDTIGVMNDYIDFVVYFDATFFDTINSIGNIKIIVENTSDSCTRQAGSNIVKISINLFANPAIFSSHMTPVLDDIKTSPIVIMNRFNSNIRLANGKASSQFFAKQVAQQVKSSQFAISQRKAKLT